MYGCNPFFLRLFINKVQTGEFIKSCVVTKPQIRKLWQKMNHLCNLLVLALLAGVTRALQSELTEPRVLESKNGLLDIQLDLNYVNWTIQGYRMNTRGFADSIPGLTLKMKAGDKLRILLKNKLHKESGCAFVPSHNSYKQPEVTNLHTHGMYVSSTAPSDDVTIAIGQNESYQYSIDIPTEHAAGSHWYHPHHHGSTALQVGGGAFGAIIIGDDKDALPEQYQNMSEKIMVVSFMNMPAVEHAATYSCDSHFDFAGETDQFILVNGQMNPKVTMNPNEWYRWRIVYASIGSVAKMNMGVGCEMKLLAKDGVYLNEFPRDVDALYLPAGGRADVAVRCSANSSAFRALIDSQTYAIVTPVIRQQSYSPGKPLLKYNFKAPNYLRDLRYVNATTRYDIGFTGGIVADDGSGSTCVINGRAWINSNTYNKCYSKGDIVESRLTGIVYHPMHMHIYPFQLQEDVEIETNYYKAGDWHDTLQVLTSSVVNVKIHITNLFSGKQMVHCHILPHEDTGCMAMNYIKETQDEICVQE